MKSERLSLVLLSDTLVPLANKTAFIDASYINYIFYNPVTQK